MSETCPLRPDLVWLLVAPAIDRFCAAQLATRLQSQGETRFQPSFGDPSGNPWSTESPFLHGATQTSFSVRNPTTTSTQVLYFGLCGANIVCVRTLHAGISLFRLDSAERQDRLTLDGNHRCKAGARMLICFSRYVRRLVHATQPYPYVARPLN
jgi:hypothetical protein